MIAPVLIAITDPAFSDEHLLQQSEKMLAGVTPGTVGVQLRDKVRPARRVFELAERLGELCRRWSAPFYVNDRLDVAVAVKADGVHLGGGSVGVADARELLGPDAVVSCAAHTLEDLERAKASGATAALMAPIFATPGKGEPTGPAFLEQARGRGGEIRLYALGGISLDNAARCRGAGAHGVAAIRALWTAANVALVARQFVSLLE